MPPPISNTRTIQCTTNGRYNIATNATHHDPAAVAASINNVLFTGASKSRTDWQSSCAIILASSTILAEQNDYDEKTKDVINLTNKVNGQNDLNLVTTGHNLRKPLTINEMSPLARDDIRVAYQGVPGAYSETAAARAYPNCEAIPCDQFEVAFQAVELWIADRAVLPIENSLGGSIHRNYDLLLRHRLHIVGEVQLPVQHCLLAHHGVREQDLNRVISHPQALAQCELTLTNLGLKVTREAANNTAGAAEHIAKNNLRDTAAISSKRAAQLYGLDILADGIQDDSNNVTRFVMLARESIIPRIDGPFRTSIVFAHHNGTTVLFKVLSVFAFWNINLTKIESRPHGLRPMNLIDDDKNVGTMCKRFEYMFYVDFEASMAETRAQNALADVQEFTSFLRVLGSYPIDMTP
uniref:arogenate dehydratase 3-like n=1 Tax=Erigeron canadensis TaxID=72917 RepID=UPI001CB9916F|nr:arogenate dehydratase 3-like [Erigeron canadensis]